MNPSHDELVVPAFERTQNALGNLGVGEPARDSIVDREPQDNLAVTEKRIRGELVPQLLAHDRRAAGPRQNLDEVRVDGAAVESTRGRVEAFTGFASHPGDREVRAPEVANRPVIVAVMAAVSV